jgi:hypothetical protein
MGIWTRPIAETRPVVVRCEWGGWLAVSEPGSAIGIGTVGATEEEARQAFEAALCRWVRLGEKSAARVPEVNKIRGGPPA